MLRIAALPLVLALLCPHAIVFGPQLERGYLEYLPVFHISEKNQVERTKIDIRFIYEQSPLLRRPDSVVSLIPLVGKEIIVSVSLAGVGHVRLLPRRRFVGDQPRPLHGSL